MNIKNLKIITLAAGAGLRLKNYKNNLDLPKPLINILDKSMIEWSILSYHSLITSGLVKKSNLYFVILDKHEKNYSIEKQLYSIFGNKIKIIKLKNITRGPAETAYLAANKIKFNGPVIFNDCDHYFKGGSLLNKIREIKEKKNFSGIINVAETNSTKPDWSYIETDKNQKLIGIKEKDPVLAKKRAKGVVASYFFSNLNTFKNEAKLMINENDLSGDKYKKEFYISKIYDRLLKKKHKFLIAKTSSANPFGNPIQINDFIKKFSKSNFHPEASTLIFDIDGVILKHDKGYHGERLKYKYPSEPIKNNIELVKSYYSKGETIILMTARPESERKKLEKELKKNNIQYHKLVMGVSGGTRILINDKKPSNINLKTAIAIETNRNKDIRTQQFKNRIITQRTEKILLEGGSYAKTYLLKNNNENIVRKIVSNKIDIERGEKVLSGQYYWLKRAKIDKLDVPQVLKYERNINYTYFDMQYLKNTDLFSNYIKKKSDKESKLKLNKILINLKKFYQKNTEKSIKDNKLLDDLIIKKAIPSINTLKKSKKGKILLKKKKIKINNLECVNIYKIFNDIINEKNSISKTLKLNFDTSNKTIIHGDLTFENILVNKKKSYFIDPLGSFMDMKHTGDFLFKTTPLFDLGKLSQSIIANYENWKNENNLNKFMTKSKFILPKKSKLNEELFKILNNNFKGLTKNLSKVILLHMIIILCRIIRYRVTKYETSSILCFLFATYYANLIFNQKKLKL